MPEGPQRENKIPPEASGKGEENAVEYYWCDYCRRAYALKRCPSCGLKLKKIR